MALKISNALKETFGDLPTSKVEEILQRCTQKGIEWKYSDHQQYVSIEGFYQDKWAVFRDYGTHLSTYWHVLSEDQEHLQVESFEDLVLVNFMEWRLMRLKPKHREPNVNWLESMWAMGLVVAATGIMADAMADHDGIERPKSGETLWLPYQWWR